jgi:hypothetical protein
MGNANRRQEEKICNNPNSYGLETAQSQEGIMTFDEAVALRPGAMIKTYKGEIALIVEMEHVKTPRGIKPFRLPRSWTIIVNGVVEQLPTIRIFEHWQLIEKGCD